METCLRIMDYKPRSEGSIKPRIIIHGGAGNIKRENLPRESYDKYKESLLYILASTQALLEDPETTALDAAISAVVKLEDDPLFNCAHGAVFTRAGTIELESSVMVTKGLRKRGVGCMLMKRTKNPIKVAREMLVRGESGPQGGGAGGHEQLSGEVLEDLAEKDWGCEMVDRDQRYYFTQRRWDEHIRGLQRERGESIAISATSDPAEKANGGNPHWDGHEYLPQGTVGCVVLDRFGTICTATSTGGLTNKLPGRIGDTPTLGAGFWAEEWMVDSSRLELAANSRVPRTLDMLSRGDLGGLLRSCLPDFGANLLAESSNEKSVQIRHAVAMSGTGNGDSFLRTAAVRTAAAMSRFSPSTSLAQAVTAIAGPGGELQQSAGDRWGKTGEGEGGIIGIELVGNEGKVVFDFNCGGMFRAWVDDEGRRRFLAFREEF